MSTTKSNHHGIIELATSKTRKKEEKLFTQFSGTQLNAVLLLILADTFLVQGVIQYLEIIESDFIRPWFILIFLSLFCLVFSVVFLTLGGVIAPLRGKRIMNLISFYTFIMGVAFFLLSLFLLLVVI